MNQHPDPTTSNPPNASEDRDLVVCPVCHGIPITHGQDLPGANEYPLAHGHTFFVDKASIGGPVLFRCEVCNATAQITTRADYIRGSGFRNYNMLNRSASQLRRESSQFTPCDVCGGVGHIGVSKPAVTRDRLTRDISWLDSVRRLSDLDPAQCDDPNYPAWREEIDSGGSGVATEQGRAFIRGWQERSASRAEGIPALCPLCRLPDRVVPVEREDEADAERRIWDRRGLLVAEPATGEDAQGVAAHRHYCGRCRQRW